MPTISAYSEGLVIPQYKTTNYDSQLEMMLLQKKQSEYNSVVSRLSSMQNQSLNIPMLNLKGKQRLDQYNKDIDEMLKRDMGDLTDAKNQSRVVGVFNKISQDSDLKQRSRLSQQYQSQLSTIENMRSAKDPTKSGYNAINEIVFRKWEGGLEDFMTAGNINGWESKMQRYTPFKDIDQKLVNLTKLLHEEENLTQKPVTQRVKIKGVDGKEKEVEVQTGYDVLESSKGVSSERIRTLLESTLDQDERAQLDVMAKYRILENNNPEGLSNLYNAYNRWVSTENRNTKQQLERIKAAKLILDPSKVDSKLPLEEQTIKKAQYQLQLDQLNEQEKYLTVKLGQQTSNQFSEEEWMKKSSDLNQILPFVKQLTTEGYINGIADSLSWKSTVQKAGMDDTYFANLRIKNMNDRLNLDAELGRAGLKLKEMEFNYKVSKDRSEGDASQKWTQPGDIIKSEQPIFETWSKVTDLQKEFANKTTPIITSRTKGKYDIDPKNLTSKTWLDSNKDNHEVQLWNAYVSRFRDNGAFLDDNKTQPNITGFEVFKKQVENGDYKNDLAINGIYEGIKRDEPISQYLTDKVGKVAETINNSTDYKDVKVGDHSLADYARVTTGWNGKGEMTFNIRDGKDGYRKLTWTEVKDEYTKYQQIEGQNFNNLVLSKDSKNKDVVANPSLLRNDPSFRQLVGQAMEQEQKSSKLIQDIYLSELPQFLQGKQQISNDQKSIDQYIININEATKLVDDNLPLGLDSKDVTQISRPVGIGDSGYFMISDAASKNLTGRKLITVKGQVVNNPSPNVWYKYNIPPINQYDALQNAMFEDTGSVSRTIGGINVTINDIKGRDQVTLILKGSGIDQVTSVPKKDVNQIFQLAEQYINQYQSSKPK